MAGIGYTYPAGGFNLQTDGAAGLGGGIGATDDFFKTMALRKMQQADEDRQRRIAIQDAAIRDAHAPQLVSSGGHGDEDRLHSMSIDDQMKQLQAKDNPAPKAMLFGAQMGQPAWLNDPGQMNAYQKAAYEPGSSSFTGGPTGSEKAAGEGLSDEADVEKAARIAALKSRLGGGSFGSQGADFGALGSYGR